MCLAEFKGFAQLYCLCRRVRIRNFVFPALVTAFSPRALIGFGVFKLRRVLVRKVPIFSQPRGDRGATMEEAEVQIFFLIATIISFLSRNSSAR